jgi:hypothetical protein
MRPSQVMTNWSPERRVPADIPIGPTRELATDLVNEHPLTAGAGERVNLGVRVLLARGNSGISDLGHSQDGPENGRQVHQAKQVSDTGSGRFPTGRVAVIFTGRWRENFSAKWGRPGSTSMDAARLFLSMAGRYRRQRGSWPVGYRPCRNTPGACGRWPTCPRGFRSDTELAGYCTSTY